MEQVTITHPSLPGQPATVPASALPHWTRAGWTPVKPEPESKPRRKRAENTEES